MKGFLLCLNCLVFSSSFCQEISSGLGVSTNFISIDKVNDHDFKIGKSYSISGTLKNYFNKAFGFESGLIYSSIQYHADYDFTGYQGLDSIFPVNTDAHAGYMEFPLLEHIRFINKPKWDVYGLVGVSVSLLIHSDVKTHFDNGRVGNTPPVENEILSFQFGIGACYKFQNKISVGVKSVYKEFSEGFSSMMSDSPYSISAWAEVRYLW